MNLNLQYYILANPFTKYFLECESNILFNIDEGNLIDDIK